MRAVRTLLILTIAVGGLAACSDDDTEGVETREVVTIAEWAEQVGARCAAFDALGLDREPTDAADAIALFKEGVVEFEKLVVDTQAVPIPASHAEDIEKWHAGSDEQVEILREAVPAAEAVGPNGTAAEVEAAIEPYAERFARAYTSTMYLEEDLLLTDSACAS